MLGVCKAFGESGLDVQRVSAIAAAYVPEHGRPPTDRRTILDVMLYAAQELVWRQRYSPKPKLAGADIGNYFTRTVRDSMFDTRKVPRWYFRSSGIDEDAEDVRIARALAEAEAHDRRPLRKPISLEERRRIVDAGKQALAKMVRPAWAPPPEGSDDDADTKA